MSGPLASPKHLPTIVVALQAVGNRKPDGTQEASFGDRFPACLTLATRECVPRVFIAKGDVRDTLTRWYVQCCFDLVKDRYQKWMLEEDSPDRDVNNAILDYLDEPSYRNCIHAIACVNKAIEKTRSAVTNPPGIDPTEKGVDATALASKWKPLDGYVGRKTISSDPRYLKRGKNPPPTTIDAWVIAAKKAGRSVEIQKAPDNRENHYPEDWILDCIKRWNPRQPEPKA
jgi:hypothetical protein